MINKTIIKINKRNEKVLWIYSPTTAIQIRMAEWENQICYCVLDIRNILKLKNIHPDFKKIIPENKYSRKNNVDSGHAKSWVNRHGLYQLVLGRKRRNMSPEASVLREFVQNMIKEEIENEAHPLFEIFVSFPEVARSIF